MSDGAGQQWSDLLLARLGWEQYKAAEREILQLSPGWRLEIGANNLNVVILRIMLCKLLKVGLP